MGGSAVKMSGAEEKGRPAPTAKDIGGTTQDAKMSPAPKPKMAEARAKK